MFSKLLIANRGEIACRIIRACKKLGIQAAAVYSEADEKALHVRMADEAVKIGGPEASDSYLRGDRIISAAKKVKADAIHPGYGFLSENASFVRAVEKAGITFVGPSSELIAQMGDKVMARRVAKEAGIPVIPGTDDAIEDTEAVAAARVIGYPLMVKAADGGGGLGIRSVEHEQELVVALERARAQAESSFGSNRVYLERRVDHASHVEVQVLGDTLGNVVHLFERDCSVQRRNQKVVEEMPCPKLTPETRSALVGSAVQLAKSIGYTNAGTIEYLLDREGEFYFLEMNTRLQVEHPVTEMVTGVDIVDLQIRVAAGEELPIQQEEIWLRGAAIEVRIYPEDPETLLPSAGKVSSLTQPAGAHVRVDSALFRGYEVSPHYESLMAKLIVWGEDRTTAIFNLDRALDAYRIGGVVTNIPLARRVLATTAFKSGNYDTGFLDRITGAGGGSGGHSLVASIAVALAISQDQAARSLPSRWKMHGRRTSMVNRLTHGER